MFKGLVTLISRGGILGRTTAESLVKQGSQVVICDAPNSQNEKFVKKLGENAIFVPMDVTSEEQVTKALNLTKEKFGKLDALINCAGVALANPNFKKKEPFDREMFEKTVEHDLVGTFNVLRLACGIIGKNKPDDDGIRGIIINVTSPAVYDSPSGWEAYTACRKGITSMTLPLTRDFSNQGIRVQAITPEVIKIKENAKTVEEVFPSGEDYPKEFVHVIETILENPMMNGDVIRLDQFKELVL